MDNRYILAIDEGTTSARALIYDIDADRFVAQENFRFRQIYPELGWVEHDPREIFDAQYRAIEQVITASAIDVRDIMCIGITNQRESVVVWEKATGKPIYNSIVWQCRRTTDICSKLINEGCSEMIANKTGLKVDAYFSASKIKWILDHTHSHERAESGELLAGTMDTYLVWRLTQGEVFVTDYTNASRTMLYNIHTLDWDDELLDLFQIPRVMLANVASSAGMIGYTSLFGERIPITGLCGDQQSALFGQGCFKCGMAKSTYGTGGFMLLNIGDIAARSLDLLTTIAWGINGKITYALEGSIFNAGSAITWLRDEMGLIERSSDTEDICLSIDDTNGVYFVPAFTGIGAPYWDMSARGAIVGITRGANCKHIVRATMESMAYNTKAIFDEMQKACGITLNELRCDGGVSKDNFLMQFTADILGVRVTMQDSAECTAKGAVFLAGLGAGIFKNINEISARIKIAREFMPNNNRYCVDNLYGNWQKAVTKSKGWTD